MVEIQIDVPGCEDTIRIIPGFLQSYGIDPAETWAQLLEHGSYDDDAVPPSGGVTLWTPGTNTAMLYRGNAIPRHKMWMQTGDPHDVGLIKYGYTGWQWNVARATIDVAMCPAVQSVAECINDVMSMDSKSPHNHWIATKYLSGNDNIGAHSDKTRTIEDGTEIVVAKLGPARPFRVEDLDGNLLFEESLEAGTAIFMLSDGANVHSKHSVPKVAGFEEVTGSIVGRTIKTIVPWLKVEKEIVKSQRRKK